MEEPGRIKRTALIFAGHTFVGLGILGTMLPLLPTTIFLLLAAACYARSSPVFHHWLFHNRFFGPYLKNYKEKKGTPLSVKISSIVILWAGLSYTFYVMDLPVGVIILLLMIGIAVTTHLVMIKTLRD
jgi:hypothetical protein